MCYFDCYLVLKKYPKAKGFGIDISPGALNIAHRNAVKLGFDNRTTFVPLSMQVLLEFLLKVERIINQLLFLLITL